MIQKVRRRQNGTVATDSDHQINIGQVLPIQLDAIDAGKVHPMLSQDAEELVHAGFVRLVPRLQTFPSQRLWRLPSQLQLTILLIRRLLDDDKETPKAEARAG